MPKLRINRGTCHGAARKNPIMPRSSMPSDRQPSLPVTFVITPASNWRISAFSAAFHRTSGRLSQTTLPLSSFDSRGKSVISFRNRSEVKWHIITIKTYICVLSIIESKIVSQRWLKDCELIFYLYMNYEHWIDRYIFYRLNFINTYIYWFVFIYWYFIIIDVQ